MTRNFSKRAFDILASASALAVLAVPMALIAVAIRMQMGGPVLFRQVRPGVAGRPFEMVKFRTMRAPEPKADGESDKQRTTRLGSFLRSSSLDELPELWNVLLGEMSLVGPRPLLMAYLPRYTASEMRRHEVKPGITGWAQVNGRNAISWSEKFALDVWYVENRSFLLDLKILVMTVLSLLKPRGIDAGHGQTMPEFMGTAAAAVDKADDGR